MSYANNSPGNGLRDRLRAEFRQRATGIGVALLLEIGLLLLLLTLSQSNDPPKAPEEIVAAFDAGPEPEEAPEPEQDKPDDPQAPPTPVPQPPEPVPPQPAPPQPSPIPVLRQLPRNFDLAETQRPPAPPPTRQAYGPQGSAGVPGDSQRVGTAPNGEPMYAARWYREPDDTMLGHYLSTAEGPGYGLIACRTVREYRVESCVALSEYPEGSGISRAVLAAAWEFRVRPPRLRGRDLYGEWVRIRIDYRTRPREYQPPD